MKVHSLHFIFTWATFLILFEPYHDTTESCFHDDHNQGSMGDISAAQYWQERDGDHRRMKRLAEEVYKPLRITTFYSIRHLLDEEQKALKHVVERAVRKMASILSVIRKDGPLLLPRNACTISYRGGINIGKCSGIQFEKGDTGEYCMDGFQIPSAHLEGFVIYNYTFPDPVKIVKSGPGVKDTDFVLYVTSQMTSLCNPFKTSALAYATYCKLTNNSRPVAGQVNFCPRTVKIQKFDEELLYKTAVHELFHALGFSNKLFDKFQKCNEAGLCQPWSQIVISKAGTVRLMTGGVVREMRKHFNCTSAGDFGGPLQVEFGKETSHWDPLVMHSSIMGSMEQKPYQTLIDPISLAVFEDSGWYKVNYSQADKFIWGQGQGCLFGLSGFCEQQEGFCVNNITGCHHLRLSKARCNFNTKNPSTCGVFAADQKPCFLPASNSTPSDIEIFSSSSRCFLSSLTPTHLLSSEKNNTLELIGRCLERRCEGDKYYVRVLGGDWLLCSPESHIQVEGLKGTILCASFEVICSDFIHPEPPLDAGTSPLENVTDSSVTDIIEHGSANYRKQPQHSSISSGKATSSAQLYVSPVISLMVAVIISFILCFS